MQLTQRAYFKDDVALTISLINMSICCLALAESRCDAWPGQPLGISTVTLKQ